MYKCSKCNVVKNENQFNKCIGNKHGLMYWCRECSKYYGNNRYKEIRGTITEEEKRILKEKAEKRYKDDPEKYRQKVREYKKRNKEKIAADRKKPKERVRKNQAKRIKKILGKSFRTNQLLGCNGKELKAHLESLFKEGMTWDNYGFKGWHIDHIKPISSFDLSDPEQVKKCFHYTNLQPLWAEENLKKGKSLNF